MFKSIPRLDRLKSLAIGHKDRWFWLQAGALFLSALMLSGIWSFTLARLEHERQLVIDHASINQRNLNQIISENLRRLLDSGIQYAQLVGKTHINSGPDSLLNGDRAYSRAMIYDLDGKNHYASSPQQLSTELRTSLLALSNEIKTGATPEIVVGPTSQAPEEAWQVPMLIPIKKSENDYSGVLVLHLDLGYLLRLYQDIDIGRSGIIRILKENGAELARARSGGLEMSRSNTTAVTPWLKDGHLHLLNSNAVGNYPLVVGIAQEIDEILTDFKSRRNKYFVSLVLLTLVIFAMTAIVIFFLGRQRRYVEMIVCSEQEKRELIQQLEEEKHHANELASKDHLTGLANRRMFMSLAESHLSLAQRSRKHYALLFLDLDRFKAINDSLGHHIGDLLLQGVSNRLKAQVRQSDIVARLGGDEFVVLITGLESEYDVVVITNNLIKAISAPFADLAGHEVQVSPSIGVALFPRDGNNLDTLVRHADLAMYQSKRAGRGCCTFFDPAMQTNSTSNFDLEQRLPRAIEANEFVLHFQPKLDLHSHQICGLEALIRWQHPVHGLIYPNEFIPLAESTGHIIELGNWVIAASCLQLAEWQAEGLTILPVAINLSGRQLIDQLLPERIVGHLEKHGLNPALLQVEVTESSLIENIETAGTLLNKLVTAGIKVALDDYGSGFSSLAYIKTLPIDAIKIDRSFIHDILNIHDDGVIVLSTITLAHNLGLRVIAEGVETPAQLIFLKTGGCDEIQGYHLSRPVAAQDARQWLLNPTKDYL
jgi:diguanylate cyclase (GGDEF)-like protein